MGNKSCVHTFTLLERVEALITWGQMPYSASKPNMDDTKTYLSSSATWITIAVSKVAITELKRKSKGNHSRITRSGKHRQI